MEAIEIIDKISNESRDEVHSINEDNNDTSDGVELTNEGNGDSSFGTGVIDEMSNCWMDGTWKIYEDIKNSRNGAKAINWKQKINA